MYGLLNSYLNGLHFLNQFLLEIQPSDLKVINSFGLQEEIENLAENFNFSWPTVGEPTHRVGNTQDLASTNTDWTCTIEEREECLTKDHLTTSFAK